jgi:hypothetical protein
MLPMPFYLRPRDYRILVVGRTRWPLPTVQPQRGR